MARTPNVKQINFIPSEDVAADLANCANKTKVINEALRMYFSVGPSTVDLSERIQKLEDFQQRFMAYFARTDNKPHSEFCDCAVCISNRKFAGSRVVSLDPEPQPREMILSIIERAVEQARRMNAIVFFDNRNGYKFRINANTNANEEFAKYMNYADSQSDNSVSFNIPNPML